MRIDRVELFPVKLPLQERFVTAAGAFDHRELAVLRIGDAEGNTGLGEISPYPAPGATPLNAHVRAFTAEAMPQLDGCELDHTGALMEQLAQRLSAPVYAAIDTALLDLHANAVGIRFAEVFARPVRGEVAVNATIGAAAADAVAEAGRQARQRGFKTVKLKVGHSDDRFRVAALRDAVGYDTRIRLDANGAWVSGEAVHELTALREHGIELVEQPVGREDLAGMHRVREAAVVPVVADEGVRSLSDLERHIEHGACDGVAIKLSQVGGPARADALADRAQAAGLFSYVTSTLDGPVGLAAGLHFAASRAEIDLACGLATESLFAATYAREALPAAAGAMPLPRRTGLGVELDEDALAEHAVSLS